MNKVHKKSTLYIKYYKRGLINIFLHSFSIIFLFGIFWSEVLAQASLPSDLIIELRQEILQLDDRVKKLERDKKNIGEELEALRIQIDRQSRLKSELEKRFDLVSRKLENTRRQKELAILQLANTSYLLAQSERRLDSLRIQVGARIREMYKWRPTQHLFLVSLLNQPLLWQWQYRYLLALSRRDREVVSQLKGAVENTRELAENKKRLRERAEQEEKLYSQRLFELQQLEKERREESQKLKEQEARYQSLLEQVESDRELLFALLESQRQALKEVEVEVMRLMIREKEGEKEPMWSGVTFSQMKGSLPKPVSGGRIVRGYGQQRHPRLGTVTLNPGIDFQVPPNESVRVVAPGRVRKISWIRGFGNTIIVEHSEGFFTVYGRVERPVVREKEHLKGNDLLGFTSSGLESSSFHFGIWHQKESLDPEEWFLKE